MTYDNTNRGVLFKNKKKETDKHPDYTGKINVKGEDFRLAAWIKESKGGNKFMSLAVSEQREESKPKETRDEGGGGFDDDIPFDIRDRGRVA